MLFKIHSCDFVVNKASENISFSKGSDFCDTCLNTLDNKFEFTLGLFLNIDFDGLHCVASHD